MAEKALWKFLKLYMPQGRWTRVENADAGPGSPDVNYRIPEAEGHLELKDARNANSKIPFPDEKRGLHRTQLRWISEQCTYGGIVWVVARVGDEILWIRGLYAPAFNGATLKRLRSMASLVHLQSETGKALRKIKRLLAGEY